MLASIAVSVIMAYSNNDNNDNKKEERREKEKENKECMESAYFVRSINMLAKRSATFGSMPGASDSS